MADQPRRLSFSAPHLRLDEAARVCAGQFPRRRGKPMLVQEADQVLRAAGWVGAFDACPDTDLDVRAFGDVALQLAASPETLLRLEIHSDLNVLHLHLTDARDRGYTFTFRYGSRLQGLIDAVILAQGRLTPRSAPTVMLELAAACPQLYMARDGRQLRVTTPAEEPFVEAASACRKASDFVEMLAFADRHAAAFPASTLGHEGRSFALQNLGRLPEALSAIEEALDLEPTNGRLHYQRACVLSLSERSKQALEALDRALALEPEARAWAETDPDLASVRRQQPFGPSIPARA